MQRLTAKAPNGMYYLANIKPNEQAIEASKNTCECLMECFQRLGEYEDIGESPERLADMKHDLESIERD